MPRLRFVHALLIYLVLAAGLMPFVMWYTNNPDTFQYLAIAHRYADGSFLNVINAYWSPLVIWLLAITLQIFSNGIIAFKVLQIAIGGLTLYGWHRLLQVAKVENSHGLLLIGAIPFLLAHGMLMLTADLLFVCISLFVLRMVVEERVFNSRSRSITLGALGALWYFAKAFAFPLFCVLLVLIYLLERNGGFNVRRTKNALICAGVFFLIASPWILAMSLKYGYFTLSEAARFNRTVEVAPYPEEIKQMPLLTDGPHQPPPGAISPWESPGDVVALTPLRPWTDPARYAKVLQRNVLTIYYYEIRRQLGTLFLLLLVITLVARGKVLLKERSIVLPLLVMLVLNLGYITILVHDRYLWLNTFIMLLVSAKLLQHLLPLKPSLQRIILVLFLLLAVKRPVKQIFFTEDGDVSGRNLIASLLAPVKTLEATYWPDHARVAAIRQLRSQDLKGPLASLHSEDPVRHAYSSSLHIAYELGLTYHGAILRDRPREQQLDELRQHGIRYFAVWEGMEWDAGRWILDAAPPAPRIYELPQE